MKSYALEFDPSPRQKLGHFVQSGKLRQALELAHVNDEAVIQLAVDVVSRYCAPRRTRRSKGRESP